MNPWAFVVRSILNFCLIADDLILSPVLLWDVLITEHSFRKFHEQWESQHILTMKDGSFGKYSNL
jgi:hypothetical protein